MKQASLTDPVLLQYEDEMRQFFMEQYRRQSGSLGSIAVIGGFLISAGISAWIIYAIIRGLRGLL